MDALTAINPAPPPKFCTLLRTAAGGPLPEWEKFEALIEKFPVERGGTVFSQDQVHPYVYVVREGLVKLAYLDAEGDEWIKSFIDEGQFFASIAALTPGGRTTFMAMALEPARVERVAFAELTALAARHLPWSKALSVLTMTYAARKEQRERTLLTLSAPERFIEFRREYP